MKLLRFADDGEYLIVISAVPANEADEVALITGITAGMFQEMLIALPPVLTKADGDDPDKLGTLDGLVGMTVNEDFSMQNAIIAPRDVLPDIHVESGKRESMRIAVDNDLAVIINVYGPTDEQESLNQIIEFMAKSIRVPIDLSAVEVSDIDLPVTSDGITLFISHPEDWETYVRGGFNVQGTPPGASDPVRLIVSGAPLLPGQTVEESLREFINLFGYEVFDTIELSDGRTAYIGTDLAFTEAVIEVEYQEGYIASMSFLPTNPDDYEVSLPTALAILESIELKLD